MMPTPPILLYYQSPTLNLTMVNARPVLGSGWFGGTCLVDPTSANSLLIGCTSGSRITFSYPTTTSTPFTTFELFPLNLGHCVNVTCSTWLSQCNCTLLFLDDAYTVSGIGGMTLDPDPGATNDGRTGLVIQPQSGSSVSIFAKDLTLLTPGSACQVTTPNGGHTTILSDCQEDTSFTMTLVIVEGSALSRASLGSQSAPYCVNSLSGITTSSSYCRCAFQPHELRFTCTLPGYATVSAEIFFQGIGLAIFIDAGFPQIHTASFACGGSGNPCGPGDKVFIPSSGFQRSVEFQLQDGEAAVACTEMVPATMCTLGTPQFRSKFTTKAAQLPWDNHANWNLGNRPEVLFHHFARDFVVDPEASDPTTLITSLDYTASVLATVDHVYGPSPNCKANPRANVITGCGQGDLVVLDFSGDAVASMINLLPPIGSVTKLMPLNVTAITGEVNRGSAWCKWEIGSKCEILLSPSVEQSGTSISNTGAFLLPFAPQWTLYVGIPLINSVQCVGLCGSRADDSSISSGVEAFDIILTNLSRPLRSTELMGGNSLCITQGKIGQLAGCITSANHAFAGSSVAQARYVALEDVPLGCDNVTTLTSGSSSRCKRSYLDATPISTIPPPSSPQWGAPPPIEVLGGSILEIKSQRSLQPFRTTLTVVFSITTSTPFVTVVPITLASNCAASQCALLASSNCKTSALTKDALHYCPVSAVLPFNAIGPFSQLWLVEVSIEFVVPGESVDQTITVGTGNSLEVNAAIAMPKTVDFAPAPSLSSAELHVGVPQLIVLRGNELASVNPNFVPLGPSAVGPVITTGSNAFGRIRIPVVGDSFEATGSRVKVTNRITVFALPRNHDRAIISWVNQGTGSSTAPNAKGSRFTFEVKVNAQSLQGTGLSSSVEEGSLQWLISTSLSLTAQSRIQRQDLVVQGAVEVAGGDGVHRQLVLSLKDCDASAGTPIKYTVCAQPIVLTGSLPPRCFEYAPVVVKAAKCLPLNIRCSRTSYTKLMPMLFVALLLFVAQALGRHNLHVCFTTGAFMLLLTSFQDIALLGVLQSIDWVNPNLNLVTGLDFSIFSDSEMLCHGEGTLPGSSVNTGNFAAWVILPVALVAQIIVALILKFGIQEASASNGDSLGRQESYVPLRLESTAINSSTSFDTKNSEKRDSHIVDAVRAGVDAHPLTKFQRCCISTEANSDNAIMAFVAAATGLFQCSPGTVFLIRVVIGTFKLIQSVARYVTVDDEAQEIEQKRPETPFSTLSVLSYLRLISLGIYGLLIIFAENRHEAQSLSILLVTTVALFFCLWAVFFAFGLLSMPTTDAAAQIMMRSSAAQAVRLDISAPIAVLWALVALSDPTFDIGDGVQGFSVIIIASLLLSLVVANSSSERTNALVGDMTARIKKIKAISHRRKPNGGIQYSASGLRGTGMTRDLQESLIALSVERQREEAETAEAAEEDERESNEQKATPTDAENPQELTSVVVAPFVGADPQPTQVVADASFSAPSEVVAPPLQTVMESGDEEVTLQQP